MYLRNDSVFNDKASTLWCRSLIYDVEFILSREQYIVPSSLATKNVTGSCWVCLVPITVEYKVVPDAVSVSGHVGSNPLHK